LVFAPVGVALTVLEDLPALIVKGRRRFETDLHNAHVIGEFVVTRGQADVIRRIGNVWHHEPGPPSTDSSDASTAGSFAEGQPAPTASRPAADPADGALVEQALAGYDTLSAAQVVRRLESLGPEELRAVHRHEASHRHRRTILNRALQLVEDAVPEPDRSVE
jgi:hypothetical protein